ncbi:MAG TPA: ABC transporter substrate-binding protein [Firmicutes bacterium]|jgi:multiple sugar transport system substrate-binding protein|nr:ABC transporter substrate-binding protein [Bacillota bacterium]
MRRFFAFLLMITTMCSLFAGCSNEGGLDPKNPVTLTLWHNYGGIMQTTMDSLVDTFNGTIGKEKGIIINITSINSSSVLQKKLLMAAQGDPGAPELPDITTCYPKVAITLAEKDLLVDLNDYFSKKELFQYVASFVDEGKVDDKLYVFPIAKSTEVLFINQTLFDRFAEATEVAVADLATFEGIARTAELYYEWTDAQTPTIPNDGKAFYAIDSIFNFMQIGMKQLGSSFIENEQLVTTGDAFGYVHNNLFDTAVKGGYAIYDGYSSDLSKTGDIICSIGSTAGILFYGDTVTYENNITEQVEYNVLPYPVFEEGKQIAIQRGAGMAVTKSDERKEYAAAVFLKWFTTARQNMQFVSETGYLPVTNSAFETMMGSEAKSVANTKVKKLLQVAVAMHKQYEFLVMPVFDALDGLSSQYTDLFKASARSARLEYIKSLRVAP